MNRVYILTDDRGRGLGVFASLVPAINRALREGATRTYQWVEPNKMIVGGAFSIVEEEVQR